MSAAAEALALWAAGRDVELVAREQELAAACAAPTDALRVRLLAARSARSAGRAELETFAALNALLRDLAEHPHPVLEAVTRVTFAATLRDEGLMDESIEMGTEALAALRADGSDPMALALALGSLGSSLGNVFRLADKLRLLREAERVLPDGDGEDLPGRDREMGMILLSLGDVQRLMGDPAAGLATLRRGLAVQERAMGVGNCDSARTLNNIGLALQALRRYDESGPVLKQAMDIKHAAYGKDHWRSISSVQHYATFLSRTGKKEEALALAEEAVAFVERRFGARHWRASPAQLALAGHLAGDDTAERRLEIITRALESRLAQFGPENIQIIGVLSRRSHEHLQQRRFALAARDAQGAVRACRRAYRDGFQHDSPVMVKKFRHQLVRLLAAVTQAAYYAALRGGDDRDDEPLEPADLRALRVSGVERAVEALELAAGASPSEDEDDADADAEVVRPRTILLCVTFGGELATGLAAGTRMPEHAKRLVDLGLWLLRGGAEENGRVRVERLGEKFRRAFQ